MSITTDFRPQTWDEIIGQDHIVSVLKKGIKDNNLSHAYLLHGIRGTGKTTTARILAKALNCLNRDKDSIEPCLECVSCKAITAGTSLDVREMDMASNRGIDDVREIQKMVQYAPVSGKKKIIILDEAHQMTGAAASALLKVLEEPPKGVIWILCTTEISKILPTIRSRCQTHAFKRVLTENIVERLKLILNTMYSDMGDIDELLNRIAVDADGSIRDAESRLSNIISSEEFTVDAYLKVFGATGKNTFSEFLELCMKGKPVEVIRKFRLVQEEITDAPRWALDFSEVIFKAMLDDSKNYQKYEPYANIIEEYIRGIYTNQPIMFLELMLFKMATLKPREQREVEIVVEAQEPDIFSLARWFSATALNWDGVKWHIVDTEDIGMLVVEDYDDDAEVPQILVKNMAKICGLPMDIDKNELIEKDLIKIPA